jgi:hypothetical protein
MWATLPESNSVNIDLWAKIAEIALIPLFGFIFKQTFESRSKAQAAELKKQRDVAESQDSEIDALSRAMALLEQRVNVNEREFQLIRQDHGKLKQDVDRNVKFNRGD